MAIPIQVADLLTREQALEQAQAFAHPAAGVGRQCHLDSRRMVGMRSDATLVALLSP
jgi:hypothetical protein